MGRVPGEVFSGGGNLWKMVGTCRKMIIKNDKYLKMEQFGAHASNLHEIKYLKTCQTYIKILDK